MAGESGRRWIAIVNSVIGPGSDVTVIGPELRDSECDSFIQRFGLNFNRVRNFLDISEVNAATGNAHAEIIAKFAFCSPSKLSG